MLTEPLNMVNDKNKDNDMVSIVVPCHNAQRFIGDTISCVQAQTYKNWELIIVDDCSGDDSALIVEKFAESDERIRLVRNGTNIGAANARNQGIKLSSGRYLCFLDADDIWEPLKLERELEFIRSGGYPFVFMGYEFADGSGKGLGKVVHVPHSITYRQALGNTTIFTSTVMADMALIDKPDILMPDIESEDTATWWKLLKKYGKAYGLDENLVRYRRSAGTLSSNKLTAVKRIWRLYRNQEGLGIISGIYYLMLWAARAVLRRI